ncbi:MAG: hypothetical protein QM658_10955 [Gordonia sp. (in: high G+C Gram-positive bacteria)]
MNMTTRAPLTLATITDAERDTLATCIHEAGHAVAAVILGGEVAAAQLHAGRTFGVRGRTAYRHVPEGALSRLHYAGPYAEARFRAGRVPNLSEIRAVLGHLGSGDHAALLASGGPLPRGIERHIESTWPAVVKLAQFIHRHGEARHADVCRALGIPKTDNGHHLSVIRSGTWPARVILPNSPTA